MDMGKPLSKAWEGGYFDILGEREDVAKSDVQRVCFWKARAYRYKGSPPSLSDRLTHVRFREFFYIIEVNLQLSVNPISSLFPLKIPIPREIIDVFSFFFVPTGRHATFQEVIHASIHGLNGYPFLALGINVFRIKVDSAVPLNSIECNADTLEVVQVLNPAEHAETKEWLHVENTLLSVFKNKGKGVVITGIHFFYRWIHNRPPHWRG